MLRDSILSQTDQDVGSVPWRQITRL